MFNVTGKGDIPRKTNKEKKSNILEAAKSVYYEERASVW